MIYLVLASVKYEKWRTVDSIHTEEQEAIDDAYEWAIGGPDLHAEVLEIDTEKVAGFNMAQAQREGGLPDGARWVYRIRHAGDTTEAMWGGFDCTQTVVLP
jgi:hypothetical protein